MATTPIPHIPDHDWKNLPIYLRSYFRQAMLETKRERRQKAKDAELAARIKAGGQLPIAISAELRDCASVLELGCMFGEMLALAPHASRTGVDIHQPYLKQAEKKNPGPAYVHRDAMKYAADCESDSFDAVILIDFIEHFERQDSYFLIEQSKRIATKKVVVFVPYGEHPQEKDVFRTGADYWQTHRSEWTDDDMRRMGFQANVWKRFHRVRGKDHRAIFATWAKGDG